MNTSTGNHRTDKYPPAQVISMRPIHTGVNDSALHGQRLTTCESRVGALTISGLRALNTWLVHMQRNLHLQPVTRRDAASQEA